MDLNAFYNSEFDEHAAVGVATHEALQEPFTALVQAAKSSIEAGGKILFFGNGGSAADCQHLATELTIRYKTGRDPIAAMFRDGVSPFVVSAHGESLPRIAELADAAQGALPADKATGYLDLVVKVYP